MQAQGSFGLLLSDVSPEEVAKWVPNGWKATSAIQSLWPSPVIIFSPLGNAQILHYPSSDAVAKNGLLWWTTHLDIA